MKIFKYRHWDWWRFDFYLFQGRRYELGITLDGNGYWLLAINLIFLHIEFNFMKGFQEWKHLTYSPQSLGEALNKRIFNCETSEDEEINVAVERIFKKMKKEGDFDGTTTSK